MSALDCDKKFQVCCAQQWLRVARTKKTHRPIFRPHDKRRRRRRRCRRCCCCGSTLLVVQMAPPCCPPDGNFFSRLINTRRLRLRAHLLLISMLARVQRAPTEQVGARARRRRRRHRRRRRCSFRFFCFSSPLPPPNMSRILAVGVVVASFLIARTLRRAPARCWLTQIHP